MVTNLFFSFFIYYMDGRVCTILISDKSELGFGSSYSDNRKSLRRKDICLTGFNADKSALFWKKKSVIKDIYQ